MAMKKTLIFVLEDDLYCDPIFLHESPSWGHISFYTTFHQPSFGSFSDGCEEDLNNFFGDDLNCDPIYFHEYLS